MLDDTSVSKPCVLRTPNFKAAGDDFVVKRPSCFMELDSSPTLEAFDSTADEDLWMQLNKGCITDLDMLQLTPDIKCQPLPSLDMPHVSGHFTLLLSFTFRLTGLRLIFNIFFLLYLCCAKIELL